ncbi:MAG TPA: hypothetical protein VM120_06435 [Bryobacteraceae bacterium]|nr:hypothetical protein [Bryobacteraceae bacterium]
MNKLFLGALVLSSAMFAGDMTGWISDSSCGASNASAEKSSRECAATCLKNGSKAVFVSDKDQKVYKLSDSAKAARFLDKKVKVSGKVTGDTIELASIGYAE